MSQARASLFSQITINELFARRTVCNAWREDITSILNSAVTHVILLEDRFNAREYDEFISATGLKDDKMFQLETFPSHSTLVLFSNDIFRICVKNKFVDRLSEVTKLTFYGGSSNTENWHKDLDKLVEDMLERTRLDTLVVHRYGYYPNNDCIESKTELYSQLKEIHLVQPSLKVKTTFSSKNFTAKYAYAGGHEPSSDGETLVKLEDVDDQPTGVTKVYLHHITPYENEDYAEMLPGADTAETPE